MPCRFADILSLMTVRLPDRDLAVVLPEATVERLRAFRREAERALPGRIKDVVLFGSRARGDARRDSDYDVAVLIRDLTNRQATNRMLSDIAYRHLLVGMHIVPLSVSDDFLDRDSVGDLAASIRRDGIVVR
jgi:predicted nucleotidyltransferase